MAMRVTIFALTVSLAAAVAVTSALAGGRGNKRDPTFILRSSATDFVKESPGDQAFEGGAVRFTGPEKGPYIERCYWTFNNPFNSPLNPTQRCVRYTLENTQ